MLLSRVKPAVEQQQIKTNFNPNHKISFKDLIQKRDYTGALTILKFDLEKNKDDIELEQWIAYCYFHLGDYKNAMFIYKKLSEQIKTKQILANLSCCYFYLGMYPEADEVLQKSDFSEVKIRLQFHLAHKQSDEKKLMEFHELLADVVEDQLSLAAIHYLRSHYQEAIDLYKKLMMNNRKLLALNVYMALCYYKLDFYDVSQEILDVYIKKYPDSMIVLNLKACNVYRLYDGKAAEGELKNLIAKRSSTFKFCEDLIKHNMVVFRNGEGALQVLPPLVDILPEARLNLVIHNLKQGNNEEAYELIKDLEPASPQEYILKAIVNVVIGQEKEDRKQIEVGQQLFNLVGSSSSECDTIPGRQCMASAFFLEGRYDEVNLYLNSIKSYFSNDDNFNFNFAQVKLALGEYKDAEDMYLQVKNNKIVENFLYISHLTHCFIMNKKPQLAWDLYLKMENSKDSIIILQSIANDCYKTNQFWHSAKAFDMLEKLDLLPEYWEGKRGACAGAFQQIVLGKHSNEQVADIIQLLRNSANSQVENMIRMIKKWAKNNKIIV
ncbi:intraflagellar transport protein 56 isoform X4 [Daktulosphaira vitifoliae]|uniref:intraflagellar transport protein 56 isoform X3 n=1 Tax=Daktulosphaira vitifoliae TaxID=58002 RepID=UPI0021A9B8FF|nr:intraflagellar transport protein 56 isoform X3 [Daktulosphaira vitifoliae]XP_050525436.1 intraflagellar transport protein 56 isoform X4 [Daktulosphaira vitifoliae]